MRRVVILHDMSPAISAAGEFPFAASPTARDSSTTTSAASAVDHRVISAHERGEMAIRGVTEGIVTRIISSPDQEVPVRAGRVLRRSGVDIGSPHRRGILYAKRSEA
jgi:hypothetical protein